MSYIKGLNKKTTDAKIYQGHPINNGKQKDFECYIKTLEQIFDQTFNMLEKHNKVLNVRLDIRNPVDTDEPIQRKDMTRILENAKRGLNRAYKSCPNKIDFNYVWTTENEGTNKHPHYHLYVSVNGNACQNGYGVYKAIQDAVNLNLGRDYAGLVEFSKSNGQYGLMVNRNSYNYQEEIDTALYAGSYLAKVNTKEGRPKGARVSSASKIERNTPLDHKEIKAAQKNESEESGVKAQEEKPAMKFMPKAFMAYLKNYKPCDQTSVMAPPETWSLPEDFCDDEEIPEGRML